ncbi:MAG: response regulator [bacterium]
MFTILTVDDEVMICNMLCKFLQRIGYETLSANSGEEALELINKNKPDLVLLDIRMPGIGGKATLKEIKKVHNDLPVIMVTGMLDEKEAIKLLDEGAADYITKPIDFAYLEKNLMVWKMMNE